MTNFNMTEREPMSPGEMLQFCIGEYGITQAKLAEHLGWTPAQVNQIVKKRQAITAEIALCLGDAFGNSAGFWINAQQKWDLWHAMREHKQRPMLEVEAD